MNVVACAQLLSYRACFCQKGLRVAFLSFHVQAYCAPFGQETSPCLHLASLLPIRSNT
jgi:hypothetical protein